MPMIGVIKVIYILQPKDPQLISKTLEQRCILRTEDSLKTA
jgi:hypothetical protein